MNYKNVLVCFCNFDENDALVILVVIIACWSIIVRHVVFFSSKWEEISTSCTQYHNQTASLFVQNWSHDSLIMLFSVFVKHCLFCGKYIYIYIYIYIYNPLQTELLTVLDLVKFNCSYCILKCPFICN